jgi:hypothetical protein
VSEINKISISHEVIHNAICPKRFFTLFDGEFTSSIDAYRKIFNQAVDISCNLISYIGDGSSENKELNLNNIKTDSLKINSLLLFKSDREKFESLIESCKRLDQHKAKRKLDVITSSGPCHLVNTNLYQVFQFSSLNAEEIKSLSFKRNGEYRILNQDEFKRSVEMIEEIHDPIGNFKSIHEAKQYILIHFSLFDYVYIIRCLNGASTG